MYSAGAGLVFLASIEVARLVGFRDGMGSPVGRLKKDLASIGPDFPSGSVAYERPWSTAAR